MPDINKTDLVARVLAWLRSEAKFFSERNKERHAQDFREAATLIEAQAAEISRLRDALKPFAEYMNDGGDLDNLGKPLPDDQGVGWIYLTQADFRRARTALEANHGRS